MRQALSITITVFVKPEEPEENNSRCIETIKRLSGLDLEKEKLQINKETVEGFNNRHITIYTLRLTKESHTNECIGCIFQRFNPDQIELLSRQKESRVDEEFNFFIRLGKEELLRDDTYITDSGDCFHIKIVLAAYPKKREVALALLEGLFDKYLNRSGQDTIIADKKVIVDKEVDS